MNKKGIIKKRDLYWCIVCLVLFILAIFTVKLGDNQNVIDYFGFAGTLIGILLAVVALIYAFYQNYAFQSSTGKLEDAAQVIQEVTKQLEKVNEIERIAESVDQIHINLQVAFDHIQASVDEFTSNMHAVGQTYESINSSMLTKQDIALFQFQKPNDNQIDEDSLDSQLLKVNMINYLPTNNFLFVYFLYKVSLLGKEADLKKYSDWSLENVYSNWSESWKNENKNIQYQHFTLGSFLGTTQIFSVRGWLEISGNLEKATVKFDDDFKLAFESIVDRIDNNYFTDAFEDIQNSGLL